MWISLKNADRYARILHEIEVFHNGVKALFMGSTHVANETFFTPKTKL